MEGEIGTETTHTSRHKHPLILKEIDHAESDFCCDRCRVPILCKTFVYTCAEDNIYCACFFLHKNCADFPIRLMHPSHKHLLNFSQETLVRSRCSVCRDWNSYNNRGYVCYTCGFELCLRCAVTPFMQGTTIQHWSHQHRPLHLMQRYATFECDACNTLATDYSYRCDDNKCPFWIHQSCAALPRLNLFGIHHKHPLQISDSLPEVYCRFDQYCKICKEEIKPSRWLYYCADCRFFAHIRCALSATPVSRSEPGFDDEKLMHLPAPNEQSLNFMMQKCIKDVVSLSVDITEAPPDQINHWAHEQHPLALKNKNAGITTTNDDFSHQVSERLIICDGCTKPISSSSDDADIFYECSKCNYSLHRYCAQFPNEVKPKLLGVLRRFQPSVFRSDIQRCCNCNVYSNGLMFETYSEIDNGDLFDVWCACLPEKIMHITHHHPLEQMFLSNDMSVKCKACCDPIYDETATFGCDNCDFFIHHHCALRPTATFNHRWDPHPLRLVLSVEDGVEDHPHDFECEYCSDVIDTNGWFYHCNICDLSLHLDCMDPVYKYSNVKFGATNIKIEAHEHDLTFILNKKKPTPCTNCGKYTNISPGILKCKPCNFVQQYCHHCG